MKSMSKFLGATTAAFFALTNVVIAAPCDPGQPCNVPEPSSLGLVGLAIAGVVWIAYKARK